MRSPALCPLTIASKYPPSTLNVKASNPYIFSSSSSFSAIDHRETERSELEKCEISLNDEGIVFLFGFGFLLYSEYQIEDARKEGRSGSP